MKFLLKLKAWQLFLLVGIPFLVEYNNVSIIFDIITWFATLLFCLWIYQLGITMYALIPEQPKKPTISNFKRSWVILVIIFIFYFSTHYFDRPSQYFSLVLGVIILICLIYCIGFSARMLESKISGRIENRSDSLKAILLMLIFPIGVWFLQPIINKIVTKEEQNL